MPDNNKEKEKKSSNNKLFKKREKEVVLQKESHKPQDSEIQIIIDAKLKEKEIKRKKRRFNFFKLVFGIFLILAIIIPYGVKYYKENYVRVKPRVQDVDDENKKPPIEEIDPESIVEYSNDDLKITLEHLRKAILIENIEELEKIKRIEIIYDKNEEQENLSFENLTEGYIFRISTFLTSFRNIDEITQVKKDALKVECPETAVMTNTVGVDIDGIEGRTFEVRNCGADFKLSYVVKNGLNYEFAQIFKGDLGYRQAYKAETENIFRSIRFYPDVIPDPGPIETFTNDSYKFSFEHPRYLDKECCNITGPMSDRSEILITLGDVENSIDGVNIDTIAVFMERKVALGFLEYLEDQKKLLTDDYLVAKGESPRAEIREVEVGDRTGVMLRGYSWKGNDLIYINTTDRPNSGVALVISIQNYSGESFEKKVEDIFKSFVFY